MQLSFVGWFFKRVDCGFLGAHFSLIFCEIQQFLLIMLSCLALPRFTCRFYILIILFSLGIPWSYIDFFSLGFDVIHSQALPQPRCPVHIRNVARSQCRSSRCHTKFKSTKQRIVRQVKDSFGGWTLLIPSLLPHIPPLLPCFPHPPEVSVTRAHVVGILWVEA